MYSGSVPQNSNKTRNKHNTKYEIYPNSNLVINEYGTAYNNYG